MRSVTVKVAATALAVAVTSCGVGAHANRQSPHLRSATDPASVAAEHLNALILRHWESSAAHTLPAELSRNRAVFEPLLTGDTTGRLLRDVMGIATPAELQGLTDVEFNARLLQFHVELASQGTAFDRYVGVEVLGVASSASSDTAYVISRWVLPPEERPFRVVNATQLQWQEGRWWLSMLVDFEYLREFFARVTERSR